VLGFEFSRFKFRNFYGVWQKKILNYDGIHNQGAFMHIARLSSKKICLFTGVFAFTFFVAGCGGDSSSSPSEDVAEQQAPASCASQGTPVSSADVATSSATVIASSDAAVTSSPTVESSSAVESSESNYVAPTDPAELLYTIDPSLAVTPDSNGFYYVADIYKALPATSKVVFVLRHSERGKSEGQESQLTENGVQMALNLGADMAGGDESFYYASTDFIRTRETCNNIAKGRAEADTLADTIAVLNDDWFVKDTAAYNDAKKNHGGGWKVTSKWAYQGSYSDAFYDLNARSTELIDDYLIPAFENSGKQVGLFVSHDVVMVPLVVYASGKKINLKYYEDTNNRWLNYLGGIAIVFKPDGTRVFYVVKGLDSGTM
jgi:broad specificity phosphatase PhoE